MDPVVELQSGLVRGIVEKHEDGFDYFAFKGVPYASPPIGQLRFEDPVPARKWTGILDCKKYGSPCLQYDLFLECDYHNEDCLHLNVYTRRINEPNANIPVIVWLHGGEFTFGSASDTYAGPEYLIRKNIVLVAVNYRVGLLGFLNLEDKVAPGNQGLKDQIMALTWVQQNIRRFGGNPNNVTVSGITAGAVSAHCLALSPLARGLLHKVICLGSVLQNQWPTVENPKQRAIDICSFLGKTLKDSREIVDFLRTVDAKQLLEAQEYLRKHERIILAFGPAADSQSSNPVFPVDRFVAADRGVHVPCLVGLPDHGGQLGLFGDFCNRNMPRVDYFKMCDEDFEKMFVFHGWKTLELYNLSVSQCRRLYYKSETVSEDNLDRFVDLMDDVTFFEGIHRFAKVQAEKSSALTYMYRFDYESPNALKYAIMKDGLRGANHMDELPFLFKMGGAFSKVVGTLKRGTRDYRIMDQMTEMFSNFAAYGRPTVELSELIPVHWKPVTDGTLLRHIVIDEDLMMENSVNIEQKFMAAAQIKV